MRTKLFYGSVGAALLGICSLMGTGDARTAAEVSEPPALLEDEVRTELPILFDYRQVLEAQDISGLAPGTHVIDLDVYAPSRVGWTRQAERRVIDSIRVLHVDEQTPAATRVTFGPPGRTGARAIRVEMDLTNSGSWVVILGKGLVPAHANPELLAQYDVRDPATLKARGDYEFYHPGLMLRTVGHCNHVHKVSTEVDDRGTLRAVRLHFSEPLEPASVAKEMNMGMKDTEGQDQAPVRTLSTSVTGRVLEVRVPAVNGARGALEIPLARIPGFAGRFRDALSCDEEDGSIEVGYLFGDQTSGEQIVSPLRKALYRALGEEK